MAISKIVAIKATLNKVIDYIVNPEKTDRGLLVSSFGCTPETADIEMRITAEKGSKNGNRIAYHLIQSFSPRDEISPEKALELGKEFAAKVTNGKYEFVIATHTDGEHLHNHIVFNATSFVDRRKYHYGSREKERISQINDKICKENNLSIIEKLSGKRGQGKYEYSKRKENDSWKQNIQNMIDSVIAKSSSYEEFCGLMELEGYEIKQGKHIAFRAPGQERFCRGKRIGEIYTEEAIRQRIENKEIQKASGIGIEINKKKEHRTPFAQKENRNRKINLIVDISKNIKAQQSKGYEQALIKSNINTMVKTMNYLIQHNLKTPEEFQVHYSAATAEYDYLRKSKKKLSLEMLDLSEKIKFTQNYKKNKYTFIKSLSVRDKQEFYKNNEEAIIQYKASLIYFEKNEINPDDLDLRKLFEEYRELKGEKAKIDTCLKEVKARKSELDVIKKNIEYSLEQNLENEKKQDDVEPEKNTDQQRKDLR